MATLKQIRSRIKTARNIQQITRAMKLVAAARLRRATDKVLQSRPYNDKLRSFMQSLGAAGELPSHPLMDRSDTIERYCLILVTADRGLCGSYNSSLIRKAQDFMKDAEGEPKLITVGKKGLQFFRKRGYDVVHSHSIPGSGATISDAVEITRVAREMFEDGEVDAIYICYSKFFSAVRQVPQVVQLLPIEPPEGEAEPSSGIEYQFEPDSTSLLGSLLPRYFLSLVWQALLEATASEHGSRMSAMTSATDNAGKMIQELTLKANRERQTAITTEILEVVGGADALKA